MPSVPKGDPYLAEGSRGLGARPLFMVEGASLDLCRILYACISCARGVDEA